MPYKVQITNTEGNKSWSLDGPTADDYQTIKESCKPAKTLNPFLATLIPVRANKHFAQDFFLPTMVNRALRVNNVAAKIFAVIGALLLDLLTFPIRLLTAIPRAIALKKQGPHPLQKILMDRGALADMFKGEHVRVTLQREQIETSHHKIMEDGSIRHPVYQLEKSFDLPLVARPYETPRNLERETLSVQDPVPAPPSEDPYGSNKSLNIVKRRVGELIDQRLQSVLDYLARLTDSVTQVKVEFIYRPNEKGGASRRIVKDIVIEAEERVLDAEAIRTGLEACKQKVLNALTPAHAGTKAFLIPTSTIGTVSVRFLSIREEEGATRRRYYTMCPTGSDSIACITSEGVNYSSLKGEACS